MSEKEYYKILRIESSAEKEQIHEAYKKLAREYQQAQSNLSDFIYKMKELNEAYLTLGDSDDRAEYDAGDSSIDVVRSEDSEDEDSEQPIPIERDEDSENLYDLKLENCSAYLAWEGAIEIMGEVAVTGKKVTKAINEFVWLCFNVYDTNGKLIGTGNKDLNNSALLGKSARQTFQRLVYIKPKKAIPAKVKVYLEVAG